MKIGNILQAFKVQISSRKSGKAGPPASQPTQSVKDSVKISSEAKVLQQTKAEFLTAITALKNVPPGRQERIQEVSSRVQSGFYKSAEFSAILSDRVTQSLTGPSFSVTPSSAAGSADKINAPEIPSNEKIDQIKERVKSGYYDGTNVKNDIAEKLLRNFGL